MITIRSIRSIAKLSLALASFTITSSSFAETKFPQVLDNFDKVEATQLETPRLVIDDSQLGGKSNAKVTSSEGIMKVEGEIVPGRGQPGFISMVMLLSSTGTPEDLSQYSGLRIRIKVSKGSVSVLAASAEIQNFDYHSKAILRSKDAFQEIRIPFTEMRRVWSENTSLDLTTITSINLVASGMQKGSFLYEVDELGFY